MIQDPSRNAERAAANEQASDDRYSRQRLFAQIGDAGQERLLASHVAIVGCGATGAAAASLLARAGVGRLTIVDRDFVEESNLQRQVLFLEEDAHEARPKAVAAQMRLKVINSSTRVEAHVTDLVPGNVHGLLAAAELILDGTDNFETRFLLNDYAVQVGKPWIYAAALGAYAATMNVLPGRETACLACLFPEPPAGAGESCDTAGILNTAVNLAASLQVTEALKFLVGDAASMRRTLWSMHLWSGEKTEISNCTPREDCEVCGHRRFRHLAGEARPHITLCGRNSVQIHASNRAVNLMELAERLRVHGQVRSNGALLRFEKSPYRLTVFPDGRTLVQGTTDPARARILYARYVGA